MSVLAIFVTFQTMAVAQWGLTRCANDRLGLTAAFVVAVAVGGALFVISRRGLTWKGFGMYAWFFVPVLLAVLVGLLNYNPATNSFLSPGCRRV